MTLRLRTAFGIPRTSPAARAIAHTAAASVPFRTRSVERGAEFCVSSRPLRNGDGIEVLNRVFARSRRPVYQRVNHPRVRHHVRFLDKCWGGENLECGRLWITSAARESGDGHQESADDDDFDLNVQRFREPLCRDSLCVEAEADSGPGNFSEGLHDGSRDVRELSCLTRVVESPGHDLLAVLHEQEERRRQRYGSNGSVRLMGSSRFGGNAIRRSGKRGLRSRTGAADGGGSSKGREVEVREMTEEVEASRDAGDVFLAKMKLPEDSNAEGALEDEDNRFMEEALLEARKAAMAGEVPVGCVIVQNRKIIARAYNSVESKGDPTAHAELLCIQRACKNQRNWRLTDATMYVTLEPCPMCAGAVLQARVGKLVWGSRNTLLGADGSWVSLFQDKEDNTIRRSEEEEISPNKPHPFHRTLRIRRSVLENECAVIMKSFFQARRKNPSMKTKPSWLPMAIWQFFHRSYGQWPTFRDP